MIRKNEMVRTFLALEIPEEVRSFAGGVARDLKQVVEEAKWVNPQGMHLTLKFLGDIPSAMIPRVVEALEKPLAIQGPITLQIANVGCFPNLKRPRVIWVGIIDQASVLTPLVKDIEDALVPLGLPRETRPFSPHLTLARIKQGRISNKGIEIISEKQRLVGPIFAVECAVLFQSILKPQGAQYHPIKRFHFLTG